MDGEFGPSWKKSRSRLLIGVTSIIKAFKFEHQESQWGIQGVLLFVGMSENSNIIPVKIPLLRCLLSKKAVGVTAYPTEYPPLLFSLLT